MPKYLIAASYTGEGLQGLRKERRLFDSTTYLIADLSDIMSAAALGIATSATGLVRTSTTALMIAEDVDARSRRWSTKARQVGSNLGIGCGQNVAPDSSPCRTIASA
jgi:hypothetical protein